MPSQVLIIGGGPVKTANQVAIESNVRYVDRLLGKKVARTILFADGKQTVPTVQYLEKPKKETEDDFALHVLLDERWDGKELRYRPTQLTQINGPTQKQSITEQFDRLGKENSTKTPLLLYFTGHGSPEPARRAFENNQYDLWNEDAGFTVSDLSKELTKIPLETPISLVMVQCYSGAFANLQFDKGDPKGNYIDRPFCGFFATIKERVAAGCTPEVEDAEYHDFTSYFFAALSGVDRVGRKVKAPDYNKDGKVGMNEAYCYTLITDNSIDIPTCTSDLFLRRFGPNTPTDLPESKFSNLLSWANPAQKAALEGLRRSIGADAMTENCIEIGLKTYPSLLDKGTDNLLTNEEGQFLESQRRLLEMRFPAWNRRQRGPRFPEQEREAARMFIASRPDDRKHLISLAKTIEQKEDAQYQKELQAVRWLRLVRLGNSVLLEKKLRDSGDKEQIERLNRLQALEAANPLL